MRTLRTLGLARIAAAVALAACSRPDAPSIPDAAWYAEEDAPPAPSHPRIEDGAALLGPYLRSLGAYADAFREHLGIDARVVTTSAPSESIDRQANHLFRERDVGRGAPNGGVLVLLNPRLGKARIEVSNGLDAVYTDAYVGRIARQQLAPYASYGIAGMAVLDALHALKDRAYEAAVLRELEIDASGRGRPEYLELERILGGGAGSKVALSDASIDVDRKARVEEPRRSRYAPSEDPEESVEAFLRATAEHAGDPSLELFTEGSRLMRARYPVAEFEDLRIASRIERSRPLEVRRAGNRAVATSSRRVPGFVPVLLHREGGLWRIDLVETWKSLFFDHGGEYALQDAASPYAFGLADFGDARAHDHRALPLAGGPGTLERELAELEARGSLLDHVRRGDLLFRNADLMIDALASYEAALAIAPDDPLPLERLSKVARYHGFGDAALPALIRLGPGSEHEMTDASLMVGDLERAQRWAERAAERDPLDPRAIEALWAVATRRGDAEEADALADRWHELRADPAAAPVELAFTPREPRIDARKPASAGVGSGRDPARFGATITNRGTHAVEVESIVAEARGDGTPFVLGEIAGSWPWPTADRRLEPGASVAIERAWGFPGEATHTHVRYAFHLAWRDLATGQRRRRTQSVDALPAR